MANEAIVSRLDTLVLSYDELSKMGFDPAFIEDYLNQLRNIFLLAGVEDELLARIIKNEEDIAELIIRVGEIEINLSNLTLRVDGLETRVDTLEDLTSQLILDLTALTLRVDDIENVQLPEKARWLNTWVDGEYIKNDFVRDGAWTMIANKTTTDRPAPQALGDPITTLPDQPNWAAGSDSSSVFTGHLYTFIDSGWFRGLRVWVPEVSNSTSYRFIIIRNPNTNPVTAVIDGSSLNASEWTVLGLSNELVLAGEEVLIYIDALNTGASTTWQYPWIYAGSGNNLNPDAGEWSKNNPNSTLRINKEDGDGVDHTLELDVIPNTTFTITQLDNPNKYISFITNAAAVDNGAYYTYQVTETDIGGSGIPDANAGTQIRAEQPVSSPTQYVELVDYWDANEPDYATVQGFKQYNGIDQPNADNDAFGVDISFQKADVSEDWDLVATSDGAGGGSGSGAPVKQDSIGQFSTSLTQTPTGLGAPGAITVHFGAGGSTSGGEFDVDSSGVITCNMNTIQYNFELGMRIRRSGASQVSNMVARMLYAEDGVNFVQVGGTFGARIDAPDTVWRESFSIKFSPKVGSKIKFEVARDEAGNNSGEIGTFQPTGTLSSWNPVNSASLDILKTVIQ